MWMHNTMYECRSISHNVMYAIHIFIMNIHETLKGHIHNQMSESGRMVKCVSQFETRTRLFFLIRTKLLLITMTNESTINELPEKRLLGFFDSNGNRRVREKRRISLVYHLLRCF